MLYVTLLLLDLGVQDIALVLLVKSDIAVVLGIILGTLNLVVTVLAAIHSWDCCTPQRVNKNSLFLK